MKSGTCIGCGGRIIALAREAAMRGLARQLSRRSGYSSMYRLVAGLSLCAACFERLPVIGDVICRQCGREQETDELCQDCRKKSGETLQCNRSLLRYNEWGKALLSTYKYRGEERLADFFARLLTIAVHRYHEDTSFDCIATVPLHEQRLRERGFNQVDLLAIRLSAAIRVPIRSLLLRTKKTAKLSRQSGRAAREESMDGAFSWAGESIGEKGSGSYKILLLDDIYTTGSTLRSSAKTIRAHAGHPSSVYSLTIYR